MQQENLLINNNVIITGNVISKLKFSHEIYGEGFYNFEMKTERLSEAADILPVTISERIIEKDQLVPGSTVRITGQLRSYNSYVERERKNRLILTVFARDLLFELPEDYVKQNPNEVFLNGYICKPPVYRTTPFGREIADILIAVNRSYNKSDYIPCIAWGRNARFSSRLNVGENIKVWGRMQSRPYQKKTEDGQVFDKIAYEVSISKIEYASNENALQEEEKSEVYPVS